MEAVISNVGCVRFVTGYCVGGEVGKLVKIEENGIACIADIHCDARTAS